MRGFKSFISISESLGISLAFEQSILQSFFFSWSVILILSELSTFSAHLKIP